MLMKPTFHTTFYLFVALLFAPAIASGAEYTGQFDPTLVANVEEDERVIFQFDTGERLRNAGPMDGAAHIAMGKLQDPQSHQYSVLSYLVEEKGKEPVLYADLNDDHMKYAADEMSAGIMISLAPN